MLLGFCYPEQAAEYFESGIIPTPGIVDPKTMAEYAGKDALIAAIIDVLRAHISGKAVASKRSFETIERAVNEPVQVTWAIDVRKDRPSLQEHHGLGRSATRILFTYFQLEGPIYGAVCEKCQNVFLLTKHNRRFCSDQCRWDFWNDDKMKDYHAQKAEESRQHKKHLRTLKGKQK
jgi:hypothetical protein